MVSVEIALSLALVLLFALMGTWLLAAGQLQARLTDAARATARELARGHSAAEAIAVGHRITPDARVEVLRDDTIIKVSAHQELHGPGPVLSGLQGTGRRPLWSRNRNRTRRRPRTCACARPIRGRPASDHGSGGADPVDRRARRGSRHRGGRGTGGGQSGAQPGRGSCRHGGPGRRGADPRPPTRIHAGWQLGSP